MNDREMEVYTLTVSFTYNESEDPWSRTIEVKEDFTLYELHQYIQKTVAFDGNHLYEFYIGKNHRNRAQIISENTMLNEIYPMTGHKLYYLFDFGDSWLFQIKKLRNQERKRQKKSKRNIQY